ncbi:MAG TPA: hypothetical protein PKE69_18965 [Pyrinomonadaceae bacterium]|nr:hypothetical protein [Pyrinomonadaceae bacterium]
MKNETYQNLRQIIQKSKILCSAFALVFFVISSAEAQDYPKEIRGYKVEKAKIKVKNDDGNNDSKDDKDESEAFVTLGEPTLANVGLSGITFDITARLSPLEQKGKVDFLSFRDFKVNGSSVTIEDYIESFSFEKNKPIDLPAPIKVFVGMGQTLMGGLDEVRDSKEEWEVTGTVFVFGKFKKFGFSFKRVVPVPINIKIKNPIKNRGFRI